MSRTDKTDKPEKVDKSAKTAKSEPIEKAEDNAIDAINPLQAEVDALNEKMLRQFAEFDNFKKRTAKEKLELAEYTKAGCFMEILSVVDNFERALEFESKDADFKKGIEMILTQLKAALTTQGLVEIDAMEKPFDPNLHNAINQIAHDTLESGVVCGVLQKGYTLNERVIRHAMVAVVE